MEAVVTLFGSLVLPYVVLSFFAMTLVELASHILRLRERILANCINTMLADPEGTGFSKAIYCHPLLRSLSSSNRKPAYIPARLFALALLDEVAQRSNSNLDQSSRESNNDALPHGVESLLKRTPPGGEVNAIARWYQDVMDQASGVYRARTNIMLICIAMILIVPLNFDAIRLSEHAVHRSLIQKVFEAQIGEAVKDKGAPIMQIERNAEEELDFPIGWVSERNNATSSKSSWAFMKLAGLLTSLLTVLVGAPFLFDTANKFMVVRLAIKPFEHITEP
jgi:hypothetical protein